jgi:hydroxypyruvate isomerase
MFEAHAGKDLIDQLKFSADQGFTAFEDNAMRSRPKEEQERIARAMRQLNLEMGIFVVDWDGLSKPILSSGDAAMRESFLKNVRESVEIAKRVNAKYATLVVGTNADRLARGYQMANATETLKRASAICEPSGLIMVAEPLNIYRDHPNFFIPTNHEMYALMKAVGSPSCKLLFDLYHTQIGEGNIIPNINACWDEIAYIQTGDTPGRNEPGTGEVNYRNVFKHIHAKGYRGILGMEHGASKPGKEGEMAVIRAYQEADSF